MCQFLRTSSKLCPPKLRATLPSAERFLPLFSLAVTTTISQSIPSLRVLSGLDDPALQREVLLESHHILRRSIRA